MLVLKFGGTSVADADRLRQVKAIITDVYSPQNGLIVIVSTFDVAQKLKLYCIAFN